MNTVKKMLLEEKAELENIEKITQKRLEDAPSGNLRIIKKGQGVEYYYKEPGEKPGANGRYMKKSEYHLAQRLAQRDYDKQILEKVEKRKKAIDNFLTHYDKTELKDVYENTSVQKRRIITPAKLSDEAYVKQWLNITYEGKYFRDNMTEIYTERGERVRSKSEKIIADKLYLLGIPYRYEYPLVLEDNVTIYPDFTILNVDTRREFYLEHFGRMDDMEYVEKVVFKLQSYEKNGIYLGVDLFCTYETGKRPLNVRRVDDFIKKVFIS